MDASSLADSLPLGDVLALAAVIAIALGFARLVLAQKAWVTTRDVILIAFTGWLLWLASLVVDATMGASAALDVRIASAAALAIWLGYVVWRLGRHATWRGHVSRAQLAHAPAAKGGAAWFAMGRTAPRAVAFAHAQEGNAETDLFTVTAVAIFAEFAVVSTGLIPPPQPTVGLVFFGLLIGGCVLYLYHSYHRAGKTVVFFAVTAVVSIVTSLLFGHYWWSESWQKLLGLGYFASNAYSAGTTGIAFSLILYARKI